ncbi:MAG: peptidoglycan bridge formation glycyltransferase FemA/FemB family protein [Candidatus Saccharimonadales bacterium]
MNQPELTVIKSTKEWDKFVDSSPFGHPQQLSAWAKLKQRNGWESVRVGVVNGGSIVAGAQILLLKAPVIGYTIAYIPRGPLFATDKSVSESDLLNSLGEIARAHGATLLKIEPALQQLDLPVGWRVAKRQILHPKTSVIQLKSSSEEEILNSFHKDARYSIRRATRNGVEIREVKSVEEIAVMWEVYQSTSDRAGFNLYSFDYYKKVFTYLGEHTKVWLAYHEGKPAGFAWTAHVNNVAVYLYGGSNELGRKQLANYLLQWEVIRYYKQAGVEYYDLNGHINDGVGSFKTKFAQEQVEYVGTYDLPLHPVMYALGESVLPRLAPLLRQAKSILRRG